MNILNRPYKIYPAEVAAIALAEAQHAEGVTTRMNKRTYRIEYIRKDGSLVPEYAHYLALAQEGKI